MSIKRKDIIMAGEFDGNIGALGQTSGAVVGYNTQSSGNNSEELTKKHYGDPNVSGIFTAKPYC